MNKDELKGTTQQGSGRMKRKTGEITGGDRMRREGRADEASGECAKRWEKRSGRPPTLSRTWGVDPSTDSRQRSTSVPSRAGRAPDTTDSFGETGGPAAPRGRRLGAM